MLDLLVEHPDIGPGEITDALRLAPRYAWRRGDPRKTSAGARLPGVRAETVWRHVRPFARQRLFFRGVKAMLRKLDRHAVFLSRIRSGGGRVTIIGDVLDAETVTLLAKLQIDLGSEVFPGLRRSGRDIARQGAKRPCLIAGAGLGRPATPGA
jgi:hypothetical protein